MPTIVYAQTLKFLNKLHSQIAALPENTKVDGFQRFSQALASLTSTKDAALASTKEALLTQWTQAYNKIESKKAGADMLDTAPQQDSEEIIALQKALAQVEQDFPATQEENLDSDTDSADSKMDPASDEETIDMEEATAEDIGTILPSDTVKQQSIQILATQKDITRDFKTEGELHFHNNVNVSKDPRLDAAYIAAFKEFTETASTLIQEKRYDPEDPDAPLPAELAAVVVKYRDAIKPYKDSILLERDGRLNSHIAENHRTISPAQLYASLDTKLDVEHTVCTNYDAIAAEITELFNTAENFFEKLLKMSDAPAKKSQLLLDLYAASFPGEPALALAKTLEDFEIQYHKVRQAVLSFYGALLNDNLDQLFQKLDDPDLSNRLEKVSDFFKTPAAQKLMNPTSLADAFKAFFRPGSSQKKVPAATSSGVHGRSPSKPKAAAAAASPAKPNSRGDDSASARQSSPREASATSSTGDPSSGRTSTINAAAANEAETDPISPITPADPAAAAAPAESSTATSEASITDFVEVTQQSAENAKTEAIAALRNNLARVRAVMNTVTDADNSENYIKALKRLANEAGITLAPKSSPQEKSSATEISAQIEQHIDSLLDDGQIDTLTVVQLQQKTAAATNFLNNHQILMRGNTSVATRAQHNTGTTIAGHAIGIEKQPVKQRPWWKIGSDVTTVLGVFGMIAGIALIVTGFGAIIGAPLLAAGTAVAIGGGIGALASNDKAAAEPGQSATSAQGRHRTKFSSTASMMQNEDINRNQTATAPVQAPKMSGSASKKHDGTIGNLTDPAEPNKALPVIPGNRR